MSRLHLNVQCLERWQSVCTASTDSKPKKTFMRMKQTKIKRALWSGEHALRRLIVAVEACLTWNETFIMSCSLPKLSSLKSKNVIRDWIADLSCAWTSIIGQNLPSSERCSFAMNTQAVSQSPTLWDAYLRCARTTMIFLHKLQLCPE